MYIYFKCSDQVLVAPEVNLHDGYLPMVGKVGGDLQFIEPGIWFKTLIVDSVCVDCDTKILRWSKCTLTPCSLSPEERESLSAKRQLEVLDLSTFSESSQCMEFDSELDDLFETARIFFENPQSFPVGASVCLSVESDRDEQTSSQFNQEILRLVHCYILPSIHLTKEDSQPLKTALKCMEVCLQNAESEIMQKDRAVSLTESSLRRQREDFLKEQKFEKESYIKECNEEYLKVFLAHLVKDISIEGEKLQRIQCRVDELRDTTDVIKKKELKEARDERNSLVSDLERMQMVRENIKNVTVRNQVHRQKRPRKTSVKVFHEIYLEISNRLKSEKETIHKLILRKVKVSSVREAIILALTELETAGESVGWQSLYDGTGSVTDVGVLRSKPKEWTTIAERVSAVINSPNGEENNVHRHFCTNLIQKIEGSLDEVNLFNDLSVSIVNQSEGSTDGSDEFFNIGHDSHPEEEIVNEQPSLNKETHSCICAYVTAYHPDTLPLHSLIDSVKLEVKKHMDEMCKRIMHRLRQEDLSDQSLSRQNIRKNKKETTKNIWLCYESHLYEKLSGKLNEMYERRYKKKSLNLAQQLQGVSLHELGIDDPWLALVNDPGDWENTCVKRPLPDMSSYEEQTVVKIPTGTRESIGNRRAQSLSDTLSTMSIEKLYRYADKEMEGLDDIVGFSLGDDQDSQRGADQLENGWEVFQGPPSYDEAASLPKLENETMKGPVPPLYDEAPAVKDCGRTSYSNGGVPPSGSEMESLSSTDSLKKFSDNIEEIIRVGPINMKIKQLTKVFRYFCKQISELKVTSSQSGAGYQPCADDMLTVIIIMLKQLDVDLFTKLFAHLNMVLDLMPPFMDGSVHDCALMNFHAAFQYLFDKHVLNQSRTSRELDL